VLNEDFKGFELKLNSLTRTLYRKLFKVGFPKPEMKLKKRFRKGDAETLNIYTAKPRGGALGWASYPGDLESRPWRDDVVIHFGTLPGGNQNPITKGEH
jgi:hypothetical protein